MSDMQVGDCRYSLVCDDHGKMMCDPVVLWPGEDTIWLSHGSVDLTLWTRGIVMGSDWNVEVCEPDVAPVQVQGPLSLQVMVKLCDADLESMKNYSCIITEFAGQPAVVSRTGWSGGYGFEVYPFSSARAMDLWQAILDAGAEFGIKVTGPILSRAIERGVTDMGYYNNSDMNAFEDLGARFVCLDKPADFIGKAALQQIKAEGIKRHSVGLLFEANVPRFEWNWHFIDSNGNPGEVRWAIYSFELQQYIGIAVVDRQVNVGDKLFIEHPNGGCYAEVASVPFTGRSS